MPLSPEPGHAVRFEHTVNFPMRAGEQTASVQVTNEWLQESGPAPSQEPEQQVDQRRRELEQLASSKYDSGDFVLDDGVVIVKIRSGD